MFRKGAVCCCWLSDGGAVCQETWDSLLTASMEAGLWSSKHVESHLPITCMTLEVDISPSCQISVHPSWHLGPDEGLSRALARAMRY